MKTLWSLLIVLAASLGGCRAPAPSPETVAARPEPAPVIGRDGIRNNAYSLLHQLMQDERRVSGILLIKRERPELDVLIKEIARATGDAADQLKDFTKQDRSIVLDAHALPPAEQAARDATAETRKSELLGSSGAEFERHLLLSQIEALSYATHLAQVAAQNDSNTGRSQYLLKLSGTMRDLYSRSLRLLLSGPGMSPARAQAADK